MLQTEAEPPKKGVHCVAKMGCIKKRRKALKKDWQMSWKRREINIEVFRMIYLG